MKFQVLMSNMKKGRVCGLFSLAFIILMGCESDKLRTPYSPIEIARAENELNRRETLLYEKAKILISKYIGASSSPEDVAHAVVNESGPEIRMFANALGTYYLTSKPYRSMSEYTIHKKFVISSRQDRINDTRSKLWKDILGEVVRLRK